MATVVAGVVALCASLSLVPLVRRVALAYGVTDDPRPDRLHTSATPYLGGVAIAIVVAGTTPFLSDWRGEAGVIVAGALLVGLIGLVDDVRPLHPAPRLTIEVIAALLAAAAGARVGIFGGPLDWILTVVWLVGITNAFNLLDNMDGAAGVIATASAVALTVAAALEGQVLVGGLALVVSGACLGFVVYNWHPARIFMGDAGALFLGYLLAAIALKLRFPVDHRASVTAIVLLTGPAVFDTTLVVIDRWRSGRPIYIGGTDHTAHRLLASGMSTASVAILLGAAAGACSTLGVLVGRGVLPWAPVLAAVVIGGIGLLIPLLRMSPASVPAVSATP